VGFPLRIIGDGLVDGVNLYDLCKSPLRPKECHTELGEDYLHTVVVMMGVSCLSFLLPLVQVRFSLDFCRMNLMSSEIKL